MKKSVSLLFFVLSTFGAQSQYAVTSPSKYICPPCNSSCDDKEYEHPGICHHCNMVLVKKNQSKTIAFYLQDGVEVLDFAGPMEVFAYAGYKVFTVSATDQPITSQGVLTIVPDYTVTNAPEADILAFFGGNSNAAIKNEAVIDWVKNQKNIQHYFSVCTGAFILAEAGILNGKTATTFHDALDGLERNYPKIKVKRDARFVDNGKVITTAGISAGIDGALHLVAKLQGLNAARRTAYYMEYDNWNIGDGLILSNDNPYKPTISKEELEVFTGRYEYRDGGKIEISYDAEKNNLNASFKGRIFPIFHEEGLLFSDVRSEPIHFHKNQDGQITGYSLVPKGQEFKKLN